MPRTRRRVLPQFPHHVVLRGNNRRKIFSYDYERIEFLRLVSAARPRCEVHALSLLSNHIHLLVTPSKATDLGRFIKHFAQCYAMRRNRRRAASGKLFEARYWSNPIETPDYLAVVTAYIDDNALQASASGSAIYRWSTCALHLGEVGAAKWVNRIWSPSSWYLSLGPTHDARATAYRDWLENYRDHKAWRTMRDTLPARHDLSLCRRPNGTRAA